MVPGIGYLDSEEYGCTRPDASSDRTFCKRCWGTKGSAPGDSEGDADTASDPEALVDADLETPGGDEA